MRSSPIFQFCLQNHFLVVDLVSSVLCSSPHCFNIRIANITSSIRSRHPSVLGDYSNMLRIEILEQCLVWLRRPIQGWQSLPHWRQIQSSCLILLVLGLPLCLNLLDEGLFELGDAVIECLEVKVSHLLRSILKAFRSRLQISCMEN